MPLSQTALKGHRAPIKRLYRDFLKISVPVEQAGKPVFLRIKQAFLPVPQILVKIVVTDYLFICLSIIFFQTR